MQFNLTDFTHDGGRKMILDKTTRNQILKDLSRVIKEREAIPYLCCAQSFLPPQEAFDFIIQMVTFQDTIAYNCACEILRELAKNVDLGGKIDNFQNGDSIRRALILNSIPLPVDEEYVPFIFEAAKSEYNLNRCAFLNLVYRMKDQKPPISPNLTNMITHTLVKFAEDTSIPVQCVWLKPAFHYLKNNSSFPSMLNNIIRNSDPEVKATLALHFSEAYDITKEVIALLTDKNPRIVAAAIPSLAKMNLHDDILAPIFSNSSHIVRVLILRNLNTIPEYAIKDYLKENSYEVMIDLIRFLGRDKKWMKFVKSLFSDEKLYEDDSWRKSYELLSIPFEMLQEVGEDAFHFALKKVQSHPLKLMKKSVAVLASFARIDPSYTKVVEDVMTILANKKTVYASQALNLLRKEKENAEGNN